MGTRPVCEGPKPQGGRARSRGVGPHRTIDEPDEEKRARAKEYIVSFNTRPDTARGNRVRQGRCLPQKLRGHFTLEASAGLITSKTHLQEPSVCFFQIVTPLPSFVRDLP